MSWAARFSIFLRRAGLLSLIFCLNVFIDPQRVTFEEYKYGF